MIRKTIPVGLLQCNCTILGDEQSREAVVVDPGDDATRILSLLREMDLTAKVILHTHAHVDHIGATAELARATGAPTFLHPGDNFLHEILPQQAQLIGLPQPDSPAIDGELDDATSFAFGRYEIGVMHTPGHTPGSVCFSVPGEELCLSGDTLFFGGIGRTDLWGGDFRTLERSIQSRLYTLNGAVEVVPGHGPLTSIDRERVTNPFVRPRS